MECFILSIAFSLLDMFVFGFLFINCSLVFCDRRCWIVWQFSRMLSRPQAKDARPSPSSSPTSEALSPLFLLVIFIPSSCILVFVHLRFINARVDILRDVCFYFALFLFLPCLPCFLFFLFAFVLNDIHSYVFPTRWRSFWRLHPISSCRFRVHGIEGRCVYSGD